ncbi:Protein of unknown function [Nitratiruptor tergarcus DSM 16512]|uniref:YlxR domain-containing protein n=2 Tax=Nitratiruptor tergarcus TaxID=269259 RepID=A0A1W1WRZ7_9BACT|nr:Protein of unknown function [Nitratiruptor tergarcus DSM 16512]
MCINCRQRFYQDELSRLRCEEKKIYAYGGVGRSFYICKSCLEDKNLSKNLARICKTDPASALKMLKEIIDNG